MTNKKVVVSIVSLALFIVTPVAFAGHDHGGGSHESSGHTSSQGQGNEQASKTADQLLKECSEHVDSIQRNIGRLQAQIVEKRAATSAINDELSRFEQQLKEAKELVRSLRIF